MNPHPVTPAQRDDVMDGMERTEPVVPVVATTVPPLRSGSSVSRTSKSMVPSAQSTPPCRIPPADDTCANGCSGRRLLYAIALPGCGLPSDEQGLEVGDGAAAGQVTQMIGKTEQAASWATTSFHLCRRGATVQDVVVRVDQLAATGSR